MRRVSVVLGTRPEAIKMAPVIHALQSSPGDISLDVCRTGQHKQLIDPMLEWFDINPSVDLGLMAPGQNLARLTSSIMAATADYYERSQPDLVLVHGDTTTASAAASSAFLAGIPVGHVEAGLRTHNLRSPFPEEYNRQSISKISSLHFAPTDRARANLKAEGVPESAVLVTGNTVVDSLLWTQRKISTNELLRLGIIKKLQATLGFNPHAERVVLVTGHRRENFGDGFEQICAALRELAHTYQSVKFVYPVHLNPQVLDPVRSYLSGVSNIHLISPLDYQTFTYLMAQSYMILTDSGGIQEEAPTFGKPVLVMRTHTERPEALTAGTALLVGSSRREIYEKTAGLLEDVDRYALMSSRVNPFGDGRAAQRILSAVKGLG